MSDTHNVDGENEFNCGSLKSEAELAKLRWETIELRERIERARNWYTGRYLVEAVIGGLVASALFVSWFIGFYSPSIDIQKERLQIVTEQQKAKYELDLKRLKHELEDERRQSSVSRAQNDVLLRKHLEFIKYVTSGHSYLANWADGLGQRLEAQTRFLKENPSGDHEVGKIKALLTYLEKETTTLEQVRTFLETDVSRGNDLAGTFRDNISKLDNSDFIIEIIYEHDMKDLAQQVRSVLLNQAFAVREPERWRDFREDGDGPMARFFKDGPVIWYDNNHRQTREKVEAIKHAMTAIFPDNMTLKKGGTVVVPGTTWG